jgi:endonuclease-3
MRENEIHSAMQTLRRATRRSHEPHAAGHPMSRRDPFRVLITAMLGLHIRDASVAQQASESLLALADTPEAMMRLTPDEIQRAIAGVDFFRPKAHHILQICKILIERYDGQVPDNRDALMALPGIGPKTASLIIIQAYNKPGICVDMHVHRITNRWGYISTKSPEKTETMLRAKLPRDYWIEISEELGVLGDRYCLPQWPRCLSCPVNAYCDRVGVVRSR